LKRLRFLLCLSALTAFHAGQAARAAGDEAAGDASADAEGTPSAGAGTLALDAPALSQPVRDMLARHARSLQLREPLTDERSRRRALRRIRREVSDLLATEGYFTPQFDIAGDPPSLRIEPGAQAVIGGVAIEFDGDLASDTPAHAERREALRMSWRLSVGKPFRQSDWSAAKQALLDDLQARDYAAGSLAGSRAEVDPEAAKVALQVRLDSGPAFRFGDIEAVGLALHDLDLVRRYSSLRPGDPYSVDALLAFERSLQASPYFSSAQISVDRDPARAAATPVTVSVAESSPKKLSFSAGLSSNTGYRGEVGWSQNNLFDRSWLLTSAVRLEQLRQIAFADIMLPPATDGYRDSFVTSTQQSLALNTSWTWRRVDDLFNPRDGWVLNAQVGGGLKGVLSDTNFVRGYLKGQWFLPIGARDQLILRGEAGLTAGAAESLPQDFLFRTGGSTSVRGYDYLALGVRQGSAIVGGRVLGVASVEYVHWMSAQWGAAFFVDAGDAADSRKDFDTAYGAGAGVRWRSPAGPIAFDIAYGEREKTWRPHFSLAIAF
jgi:translocation and assembly module TamA